MSPQEIPEPDSTDTEPELFDTAHLPEGVLAAIEADSFWCLSKLLDGIQDNYISHQPGIHRLVTRMSELVKRIDGASQCSCKFNPLMVCSPSRAASGGPRRRVHAVRVQVDELPAHARDERTVYHPHVGYVSGK